MYVTVTTTTTSGVYAEFPECCEGIKTLQLLLTMQADKQNNASMKGDGGAVGLIENSAALHRWMVSGPYMAHLIGEFVGTQNSVTMSRKGACTAGTCTRIKITL